MSRPKLLLLFVALIGASLLLGMVLGRLSAPQMIVKGEERSKSDAPMARGTPDEERDPGPQDSPYSRMAARPDFDYEEEVWPENRDSYRFDPEFELEDEADFRREYGRDYGWPEVAGQREREVEDPPAPVTSEPAPSDRYDALDGPDRAQSPEARSPSSEPETPREPHAADAPLPAIW